MNEVTLFTPEQCRAKAATKLALADGGGANRESLLDDAAAWLLLADRLECADARLADAAQAAGSSCAGLT